MKSQTLRARVDRFTDQNRLFTASCSFLATSGALVFWATIIRGIRAPYSLRVNTPTGGDRGIKSAVCTIELVLYESAEKHKPQHFHHRFPVSTTAVSFTSAARQAIIILAKSRFHFHFLIAFRNVEKTRRIPLSTVSKKEEKKIGCCCCRWPRVPLMDSSSRVSPPLSRPSSSPSCVVFFIILRAREDRAADFNEFLTFPNGSDLFISICSAILPARNTDRCLPQPFRISLLHLHHAYIR